MGQLSKHPFSLASFGLTLAATLISFLGTSAWYLGGPLVPGSGLAGRMAGMFLASALAAIILGGIAVKREPPSWVQRVALGTSIGMAFICSFRFMT